MKPVWIDESTVHRVLTMPEVIAAVERAFLAWGQGRAANGPRRRVRGAGAVIHSMAAIADYLQVGGWKQYLTTRRGAEFHVGIYHLETGALIAILEAARLGQLRTGAATAVAVKYLARGALDRVALLGCGYQAETQLEAIHCVRTIGRVAVYCRERERRVAFAQRMAQRLNAEVIPVSTAREAVEGASLVITATTSKIPVVEDGWLPREVLIVAMGSNWPDKSELEARTVARADLVVCDSLEACQVEAGELIQAEREGLFDWNRAVELRDVVSGGSRPPSGCVLFKSVGLALEDVATAALVLDKLHVSCTASSDADPHGEGSAR